MSLWMEVAWSQVGVREIAGEAAEPRIVAYFREAGHPDIVSDETAWCAAFVAYCLSRSGTPLDAVPRSERLRAAAYANFGTPLAEPRVGCIGVWPHHVGFVAGVTETHVQLLGGNQSNACNVTAYARASAIAWRWPETVSAADLDRRGSRISVAAGRMRADAAKVTAGNVALPQLPELPPGLGKAAGQAREVMGLFETAQAFGAFAWSKLPILVAVASLFWLGRMIWNAQQIRAWRAEDASTGAHQGRPERVEYEDIDHAFHR